jgi:hypothetical protein
MHTSRLHRAQEALFRSAGGDVYLAAADREGFDRLSGSAATAWMLLDEAPTFAELVRELAGLHDATAEEIEPEIRSLLDELVRRGWVWESA